MLKRVLYIIGNLTGITFFMLLFVAALRDYQKTQSLLSFNLILVNGLFLLLYFVRREPKIIIEYPFAWLISMVGTVLPMLFRPNQEAFIPNLVGMGHVLQIVGLLAIGGSLLSLSKSFGIVPANGVLKQAAFIE